MGDLGWGLCPVGCPDPLPGYVVPFALGDRFPDGIAVKLGIHPCRFVAGPCIGSRQPAPPLPLAALPTAAHGLALQREAMEPAQPALFD